MTEVLTTPVALSAERSRRMAAWLERDARAGVDLCPRGAQIDCLTASLARSLRELKGTLGRAVAMLPEGDSVLCGLRDAVSGMGRLAMVAVTDLHAPQAHDA